MLWNCYVFFLWFDIAELMMVKTNWKISYVVDPRRLNELSVVGPDMEDDVTPADLKNDSRCGKPAYIVRRKDPKWFSLEKLNGGEMSDVSSWNTFEKVWFGRRDFTKGEGIVLSRGKRGPRSNLVKR